MHQDECVTLFAKFFKSIGPKWPKFLSLLRSTADKDDVNQIFLDQFLYLLKRFNIDLNDKEKDMLTDSFPGRDEGQRKRVNVSRLYDHKYNMQLSKAYQKVDVHDNDGEDDPVD